MRRHRGTLTLSRSHSESLLPPPTDRMRHGNSRERLAELLVRIASEDQSALALLYQATSAKLLGVILRILHDRSESEDVLQEVYISIWRRAGVFDPSRGVSAVTWLAAIARNRAIDRLRSPSRKARWAPEEEAAELPDLALSAEALLQDAEKAQRLRACLAELESHTADAIRTAFFEGVTYDALAQRLGQPVGTVKSWIRRGLLRLRRCLEP